MSSLRFIYLFINYSCFDFLERISALTVLNQLLHQSQLVMFLVYSFAGYLADLQTENCRNSISDVISQLNVQSYARYEGQMSQSTQNTWL